MWYKAESSNIPVIIDKTSSRNYVYVRKNIVAEERTDETGISETLYVYDEIKLPKDVYEIFKMETDNSERLTDVEEVIADLIFGGDDE